MAKKSEFVCQNCGVAAITWLDGWKHATGGGIKACRKLEPIKRVIVETEDMDAIQFAFARLGLRS